MTEIIQETVTDDHAGTLLGQRVSAPDHYDPSILVKVDRQKIITTKYEGFDIWNAFECSCLTASGQPVYFGLSIEIDGNSKYIVESKSLKLYLNSMNMEPLGNTVNSAKAEFVSRVVNDLSNLLEVKVFARVFCANYDNFVNDKFEYFDVSNIDAIYPFTDFKENRDLLKVDPVSYKTHINLMYSGLRSNCRVTHAPDFGTVFVKAIANKKLSAESFVHYIASFRNEYHFHEECADMIYDALYNILKPEELMVRCNYTRRGGIDINPTRSNYFIAQRDPNRTIYQ